MLVLAGLLVGQAIVVAVFGITGSFVKVFAGNLMNGIASETSSGRVAARNAILAGSGPFFGVAALDVGVAFFSAGATGTGRSQHNAGYGQRTEELLGKHEEQNWEVMRGVMLQGKEITRRRATRTAASGCVR